jgi:hypothetical protein
MLEKGRREQEVDAKRTGRCECDESVFGRVGRDVPGMAKSDWSPARPQLPSGKRTNPSPSCTSPSAMVAVVSGLNVESCWASTMRRLSLSMRCWTLSLGMTAAAARYASTAAARSPRSSAACAARTCSLKRCLVLLLMAAAKRTNRRQFEIQCGLMSERICADADSMWWTLHLERRHSGRISGIHSCAEADGVSWVWARVVMMGRNDGAKSMWDGRGGLLAVLQ